MSNTLLAWRHVPHEGLGTIERFAHKSGLECRYIDWFAGATQADFDLDRAAGLVVLGGPMNVDQTSKYPFLAVEVPLLQKAVANGLPVLGVCLGSQLLAKALGATIRPNGVKEIGWYEVELLPGASEDRLFQDSAVRETVFQWHGDTFDLPRGAVHLAQSDRCSAQAFRYGEAAYGLQFHAEVTGEMVDEWLTEPGNHCEVAALDYIDPAVIHRETSARLPAMSRFGERLFGRFAELCRARAGA